MCWGNPGARVRRSGAMVFEFTFVLALSGCGFPLPGDTGNVWCRVQVQVVVPYFWPAWCTRSRISLLFLFSTDKVVSMARIIWVQEPPEEQPEGDFDWGWGELRERFPSLGLELLHWDGEWQTEILRMARGGPPLKCTLRVMRRTSAMRGSAWESPRIIPMRVRFS